MTEGYSFESWTRPTVHWFAMFAAFKTQVTTSASVPYGLSGTFVGATPVPMCVEPVTMFVTKIVAPAHSTRRPHRAPTCRRCTSRATVAEACSFATLRARSCPCRPAPR